MSSFLAEGEEKHFGHKRFTKNRVGKSIQWVKELVAKSFGNLV